MHVVDADLILEGGGVKGIALVGSYTARVAELAVEDVHARLTFNEVISLVRPPLALFQRPLRPRL